MEKNNDILQNITEDDLSIKQKFVVNRLEELFAQWDISHSPKQMYIGGLFAMQSALRVNPDWMSQSANSFREIFYHLWDKEVYREFPKGTNKKEVALENFGSRSSSLGNLGILGKLNNRLTEITHHNFKKNEDSKKISADEYGLLIEGLEAELFKVLTRQLDVHSRIKELIVILEKETKCSKQYMDEIREYIDSSLDAAQFLFANITAESLPQFIKHQFYKDLNWSVNHFESDKWRSFELLSLERLSSEAPLLVTKVIFSHEIDNDTNPINTRLSVLRCMRNLPEEELHDTFLYLINNDWGLTSQRTSDDYLLEDIAEKIISSKRWDTFLIYLKFRFTPLEISVLNKNEFYSRDYRPFIFDIQFVDKTIDGILSLPHNYKEEILAILRNIFESTLIDENTIDGVVMPYRDVVSFISFDLSSVSTEDVKDDYDVGIMEKLLSAYRDIATTLIQKQQSNLDNIEEIWAELPESPILWKLKYLLLSEVLPQYGSYFIDETLRFTKESYVFEFLSGAEYKVILSKGFPKLSQEQKDLVFTAIVRYFIGKYDDKDELGIYASPIFSVIQKDLSKMHKSQLKDSQIRLIENYVPSPSMGKITSGVVTDTPPINRDELKKLGVNEILVNLNECWRPENIENTNEKDSYFNPINATGLAKLIGDDIQERHREYFPLLIEFINPRKISTIYLYHLLDGIENGLKNENINGGYAELTSFLLKIILLDKKGQLNVPVSEESLKRRQRLESIPSKQLLRRCISISSILISAFSKVIDKKIITEVGSILEYLIAQPDPSISSEELGTASSTISSYGRAPVVSDSHTQAINSIRGSAFRSYIYFLRRVDENFTTDEYVHPAWREVIENCIYEEKTRALHFMFGFNTAHLMSLDKQWYFKSFTKLWDDSLPNHLQLQVWNGFLHTRAWNQYLESIPIYDKYKYWINNDLQVETDRRYSISFNRGLANHLFSYYVSDPEKFRKSELFELFFTQGSLEIHRNFIDNIGRSIVAKTSNFPSKNLPSNLSEELTTLWRRYLEEYRNDELFKHFGFWYSENPECFDSENQIDMIIETLKRSKGVITFSHMIEQQLIEFSHTNPKKVIEIAELVLLHGLIRGKNKGHMYVPKQWEELFQLLYTGEHKTRVKSLVSRLIEEGGSPFWNLKE